MQQKPDRLPRAVDIARRESRKNAGVVNQFSAFAASASQVLGSAWSFMAAISLIIAWAATGPLYHFSDTWQLIINTGTTVVTFLMVFLIQNTQNRDAKAIHLKLNELIHALSSAHNELIDVEKVSDWGLLFSQRCNWQHLRIESRNSRKHRPVQHSRWNWCTGYSWGEGRLSRSVRSRLRSLAQGVEERSGVTVALE